MNDFKDHERELWLAYDPRVYHLLYTVRARRLQSEAVGHALGAAGRFLARIGAVAYRRIAAALRKRRTIAQLRRLDDHLLSDIGIDRGQIPMIAQGLIAPSGEAPRRTILAGTCPPEYRGDTANDAKPPALAA